MSVHPAIRVGAALEQLGPGFHPTRRIWEAAGISQWSARAGLYALLLFDPPLVERCGHRRYRWRLIEPGREAVEVGLEERRLLA